VRAKTTFQALAKDTVSAYLGTVSLMSTELRREVFSNDFKRTLGGYCAMEVFRMHLSNAPNLDPLSLAQYLDVKTYLPGDILTKVDRASMHHSLEVRVPLLDHKLVEWMAKVPTSLRLRGGEGKYLLKKSMEPHLPNDILYRRKMGFSVPLASWLRGPLRERAHSAINESALTTSGLFNRDALDKMMRQHTAGVRDNSEYLWQVLMFDASWKAINPST
jgi:asparagine synthase (glutamine-hydrolysing)